MKRAKQMKHLMHIQRGPCAYLVVHPLLRSEPFVAALHASGHTPGSRQLLGSHTRLLTVPKYMMQLHSALSALEQTGSQAWSQTRSPSLLWL